MDDLDIVKELRILGATQIEMKRGRILRVEFKKVVHTKEVIREVVKLERAPIPPKETEEERATREAKERDLMVDWSSGPPK